MSDSFRTTPPEPPWSSSPNTGNGIQGAFGERGPSDDDASEAGKILLVGVLVDCSRPPATWSTGACPKIRSSA